MSSGILPLEIELGRWRGTEVQHRICKLCDSACIEDESHFIFECNFYEDERKCFIENLEGLNFENYNNHEKFVYLILCN